MKKGQQEIAGYVIIVVLVVVAIFIFIIMYFANKKEDFSSKEVEVLLISMMKTTTNCFLEGERPANLQEVIKDAFDSIPRKCKDSSRSSRDYLDEYLPSLMEDVLSLETNFESYNFEIVDKSSGRIIKSYYKGDCVGKERRGHDFLLTENLQVFFHVC